MDDKDIPQQKEIPTSDTCQKCGGKYSEELEAEVFMCPDCGDVYIF